MPPMTPPAMGPAILLRLCDGVGFDVGVELNEGVWVTVIRDGEDRLDELPDNVTGVCKLHVGRYLSTYYLIEE